MTLPDVSVEIALETDPLTRPGPSDWTRIDTTCPVRSVSTHRGAGLRDGSIVSGSASVLLDNTTGDLFPGNTAGTWYPDLTLRRRIRVSLTEPTAEVLFTGYIDRLPATWDLSATDGVVELGAVDLLSLLAQVELPPSVLHQTIVDLEPVAYWTLAETQGTFADDVVGTWDGTYRRPVTGTQQIMPYDSHGKVLMKTPADNDPTGQGVAIPGFPTGKTCTVSFWVKAVPDSAGLLSGSVWVQNAALSPTPAGGPGAKFWVSVTSGTGGVRIIVLTDDGSTSTLGAAPSGDHSLTELHHVVVTVDTDVTADPDAGVYAINAYFDGTLVPWSQADPDNPVDPFTSVDLEDALTGAVNAFMGYGTTVSAPAEREAYVADVAYWDSVLTAEQIRSIYDAGVQAWDGDTTGQRLERILDALGVDDDDRDVATGQEYCGPTTLGGNTLDYLRKIAATERGALFVSADGKITYRQQFANDPTPLDVIGDTGCPTSAITVDYSLDRMVNTAEVTAENGITHSFTDATSRSSFGPIGVRRDTLHSSPSGVKSFAAELVARGKDVRTQVTGVHLESRRSDVPPAVTVGTEIGDPYTIEYDPPGLGSPAQVLVRVESIAHQITPGSWRTTFDVDQQVVLPDFTWDTADQGWDQSVWA